MGNVWNMQTTKPESLEDYEEHNPELDNSFTSDEMYESDSAGSLSGELLDVDGLRNYASFEYQEYQVFEGGDITTDGLRGEETYTDSVSIDKCDLIINFDCVTLDKVYDIEDILEVDEKVSLIYLLYENVTCARDQVRDLLLEPKICKPVYEWAREREEGTTEWKKPLVEALCIIQDYRILRTHFDYQKQFVNNFFLPFSKSLAVSVNRTRKVFYLIFDNLPSAKVREIFKKIQKDPFFNKKPFKTPHLNGNFYFELYLLDLEYLNYISKDNVTNLARIFKQLDLFAREDDLKSLVKSDATIRKVIDADENFEKEKKLFVDVEKNSIKVESKVQLVQDNTNEASLTQEQQSPSLPSIPGGNCYAMNVDSPGIALIINNKYFFTELDEQYKDLLANSETSLQTREGTEADVKALKKTFEHLNFSKESVILKESRRHLDILQDVRDAANKVTKDHSSLFVTILSHGEEDIVYGANSCKVDIEDIKKVMSTTNVAHLEGKPKILILQCCQGKKLQTLEGADDDNYETDSPESTTKSSLPKTVDHFTFMATVPGYSAIRHKAKGTWFIQAFCKVFQEFSDSEHFEDMCTEVVKRVSERRWEEKGESRCMVSLKSSTLRMKFYLPPVFLKKVEENNVEVF